jgi:hypothetical protein
MRDFLPLGTYVQYTESVEASRQYNERGYLSRRKLGKVPGFGEGFIVGGTHLREGNIKWDHDEGYIFTQTKTVFAYKVIGGFVNKPVFVLPEQIAYQLLPQNPASCPFMHITQSDETRNEQAKFMKDEMKDWPRDERGRWVKKAEA